MISIIRHTLITALRDLLFIGLIATISLAILVSCFLGSTALVEQSQMTLSYIAGSTRLINSVGIILFVCFHIRRSFENKEIEVTLTKPISRSKFVISYFLAFALLSVIINICVIIMIYFLHMVSIKGLVYWGLSLMLESILTIAFAMLSALILSSAVLSALSTLCFYFLSRMMGFFTLMIDNSYVTFSLDNILKWGSESILKLVSTILPRLDLFAKTKWLIYEITDYSEVRIIFIQSMIYIPLLLGAVIFDFKRKEF